MKWSATYTLSAKPFYWLLFTIPVAIFTPAILILSNPTMFKFLEGGIMWLFGGSMVCFMIGMVGIFYRKLNIKKGEVEVKNGYLAFRHKKIQNKSAKWSFGYYGLPASGTLGTVIHFKSGDVNLNLAAVNYYAEDRSNYYEPWTYEVDGFIEPGDFLQLLNYFETLPKVSNPDTAIHPTNRIHFEFKRPLRTAVTVGIMTAFFLPMFVLIYLFGHIHPLFSILLIFITFGLLISYMLYRSKKGLGYRLEIDGDTAIWKALYKEKVIHQSKLSAIKSKKYKMPVRIRYSWVTYQILEVDIPAFKTILFGQPVHEEAQLKSVNWRDAIKRYFIGPDFRVDESTRLKLEAIFIADRK